ncbi:hypothetical protein Tco_0981435, partial [Tanacetum coccineum]
QQPLTTPFPTAPSVPLRISSINLAIRNSTIYDIVLKLDDPSSVLKQGDSESKSNLTRTSRNVLAESSRKEIATDIEFTKKNIA